MDKSRVFKIFLYVEQAFWVIAGLLTMAGAFGLLLKGVLHLYQDFSALNEILITEFFYAIICFELMQMSRIRLMRESHRMVLYHFVFMATLTFGREIFLIHNLDIWIAAGFTLMIGIYIVFYAWSHDRPLWKNDGDAEENRQ